MENKQLTNKELDKWLAEKVMGWEAVNAIVPTWYGWDEEPEREAWYVNPEIKSCDKINTSNELRNAVKKYYGNRVETWHPTEDIKQAFECLEKFISEGPNISIHTNKYLEKIWVVEVSDKNYVKFKAANGGTLSETICQAIYKALTTGD